MKNRPKKRIRSLTAVTIALSLFVLILWFVFSYCITIATAQLCYKIICLENEDYASRVSNYARLEEAMQLSSDTPGDVEYRLWEALDCGSRGTASLSLYSNLTPNVLSQDHFYFQTAAILYDGDGSVLDASGDFYYFPYVTEETWNANLEETRTDGYAKVPLDRNRFSPEELENRNPSWDFRAMRFTGTLDGQILTPIKIEYVLREEFSDAVRQTEPAEHTISEDGTEEYFRYEYRISDIIASQNVPWHTLFESGEPSSGDTVTLYTIRPELSLYEEGGSVTYQGNVYQNLLDLLNHIGPISSYEEHYSKYSRASLHTLTHTILFDVDPIYDYTDWESSEETPVPPMYFYLVTAIETSPLLIAVQALWRVYLGTFLLGAFCVLILRFLLRNRILRPVQQVNDGISEGWSSICDETSTPPKWREPYELIRHYEETQSQLRIHQNEVTRLNTALDYAKEAEQNRRQMTSNIAHELKTPLAVIHSYAEGLKEHIAEGKREKYLDVILAESEHLDHMVLELLDLSRLEAGRVKLARDDFSLSDLTYRVFERLDMAAQAKNLKIEYHFPDDCTVTADEARIRQVIENFAANAVKYTPANGNICVRIAVQRYSTVARRSATFSIENDSVPLSDEALDKVWDTFYRADESRSGTGTGLGLAIAKSIVELHGGTCSVQNTKTGVMFQFTI